VFFGAWVSLKSESGALECYRIVGPDEFDRAPNYISMDSPLGRALMRKELNDTLTVELPGGPRRFVIMHIQYRTRPED
jgi:transcription elongation factor GreB